MTFGVWPLHAARAFCLRDKSRGAAGRGRSRWKAVCGGVSTFLLLSLSLFSSPPLFLTLSLSPASIPFPAVYACASTCTCVRATLRTARTVIQRYQQIAKSQRQTAGKCAKQRGPRDTPRNRKRPCCMFHTRLSCLSFLRNLDRTEELASRSCSITRDAKKTTRWGS